MARLASTEIRARGMVYQKMTMAIRTAKTTRMAASSCRSRAMFPERIMRTEGQIAFWQGFEGGKTDSAHSKSGGKDGEERGGLAMRRDRVEEGRSEGTTDDVLRIWSGQDLDSSRMLSSNDSMSSLSFCCVLEHEET